MNVRSVIRARQQGDTTKVKVLINHPPHARNSADSSNTAAPTRPLVSGMTCERNGETVVTAVWSHAVSGCPYLSFELDGGQTGDTLRMHWMDNRGFEETLETTVV